jgi:hypothetical protein
VSVLFKNNALPVDDCHAGRMTRAVDEAAANAPLTVTSLFAKCGARVEFSLSVAGGRLNWVP